MTSLTLGELVNDGTLQHTFSEVNRAIFPSGYFGDATLSYHCFLLAREVRRKKGIVAKSSKATDREEWLNWIFMSKHSDSL